MDVTTLTDVQFSDLHNATASGTGPITYTLSDDGGVGVSNAAIPLNSDGEVKFLTDVISGPTFFSLDPTNVYRDVGESKFSVGFFDEDYQIRVYGDIVSPNIDSSFTATVGDSVGFERAGVDLLVKIYRDDSETIIHIFDGQSSEELWPQARGFSAGTAFTVTAEIGQRRTYWLPNTVNYACDGNSHDALADPKTVSEYMRLMAPFLGSGTTMTNLAINAQTIQDMIDDHSDVDAAYDAGRDFNVLHTWEGTNQIWTADSTGVDSAVLLGDFNADVLAVHPWDFMLTSQTIPRQGGRPDGPDLTDPNLEQEAYDAYLAGNLAALHLDLLVEMRISWYAFTTYTAAFFAAAQDGYAEPGGNWIHQSVEGKKLSAQQRCTALMTLAIPLSSPAPSFLAAWARGANTVIPS